jgi:tRNA1(Val) A37 N6-methylase TrmN6
VGEAAWTADARTADAFLGGRLRLHQPAAGHRAGTDAVLLAAGVRAQTSGFAIDAGAGVGAAGLAAALAAPGLRVALLERETGLTALARANIAANQLQERAFVAEANLLSRDSCRTAGIKPQSADLVLTNPPFLSADNVRVSFNPSKATAHVIGDGGLEAWVRGCLSLLRPGGTLLMIHRADALQEVLKAVSQGAGALIILPIHPYADRPATRILVHGLKGRRTRLSLVPPLVLHGADGTFTAEGEALHRGEARIDWGALSLS